MSLALQLAELGRLTVSPNPMVGCIIVKDNQIIGQGYHQRAGEAHAEILALQQAGQNAQNATVYINLEPCCHYGRTPPCVNALIAAGIHKVYVACLDPNPLVAGKGVEALRSAGITVEVGLFETKARTLNEIFFHYIQHKTPFVIAKWAMSLDGKTITAPTDSKKISSDESQQHAHQIRMQADAILIGANTAILDDPLLTVRLTNNVCDQHPIRIILAGKNPLPNHLRLFDKNLPGKTVVATSNLASTKMLPKHIEVLELPAKDQLISLPDLLKELGNKEITSLLVEGGMKVLESFYKENLVNKTHVYIAPTIIGNLTKKMPLKVLDSFNLGRDYFIECIGESHV